MSRARARLAEDALQALRIEHDDLSRPAVHALLADHLADMHSESPPESVHALDLSGLADPTVTLWTAWDDDLVLGCAALKQLDPAWGEVKSMRTAAAARGRGIATTLVLHILDEARRRGYARLSLETGSQEFFAPARRLYERHGFTECGPFAAYREDPLSVFYTLVL